MTHNVPHAIKGKVKNELDRLERVGVIKRVPTSDWATPIVPVVKQDRSVGICGDYKIIVNQAAKTESNPLHKIEDIFALLAGGKCFSKLDLAHAYNQIELKKSQSSCSLIILPSVSTSTRDCYLGIIGSDNISEKNGDHYTRH